MTPDEVKQSITGWCASDDDLEMASDRFEPGTDFSFGLKAGTLSTAPIDLVVFKADGADRVTIRRSVTLTGDDVDAANQLIASRPGSVSAAVERSGADTTVVAQTYVYLDGLSKHTFVQAVAELARTSTLLDAIAGVAPASEVDEEAATVGSDAFDTDAEPEFDPDAGRIHLPATVVVAAAEPDPTIAADAELHPATGAAGAGSAGPGELHTAALPGAAGASPAGAAARSDRWMGAEPLGAAAGPTCVGRTGSLRAGGRQPGARTPHPGRRGPGGVGTRDLLQWVDRLDRRPDHRRRCLTLDRAATKRRRAWRKHGMSPL